MTKLHKPNAPKPPHCAWPRETLPEWPKTDYVWALDDNGELVKLPKPARIRGGWKWR